MATFKKLDVFEFPRGGPEITEDNLYWKRLGFPCAFKEFGAVDYIDFCPEEPYNVAVTCSAKVQIYSSSSNSLQHSLSRFKKTAYGANYRKDGKLLVAGSDDGFLRLFEMQSHKLLRVFKGHTAATHRCKFTTDNVHLVSFSDDKSVAIWDIPTETRLKTFLEHKDYIRAGTINESSENIFLSGSYDHTVKMYDARTSSCVLSVNHGAPVESVVMFPSGGLFISAGGTNIKIWDAVAHRMLSEISQHHKTITCLAFASDGRRLMSGSLDRLVKIYDVTSYDVVHTLSYPSPILSLSAAPGDKAVAVGMADGLFSLRQQKKEAVPGESKKKKKIFYQNRLYGTDFKPISADVLVPEMKHEYYKIYEKYLKSFQSTKALDAVLTKYHHDRKPEVTISVMIELIQRGALRAAMAGREGDSLLKLLKFVTKYIQDPRFTRELIDVGLILIEIYASQLTNPEISKMFQFLQQSVENQVQYMTKLQEIQGILQTVLSTTYCPSEELSPRLTLESLVNPCT